MGSDEQQSASAARAHAAGQHSYEKLRAQLACFYSSFKPDAVGDALDSVAAHYCSPSAEDESDGEEEQVARGVQRLFELNSSLMEQYHFDLRSVRPTTGRERLGAYFVRFAPERLAAEERLLDELLDAFGERMDTLSLRLYKAYGHDLSEVERFVLRDEGDPIYEACTEEEQRVLQGAMRRARLCADGSDSYAKAKRAHAEALARQQAAIEAGRGHWVSAFDPAQHRFYYRETTTHEVRWDKPEHYVMAADDEEMHAVILVQTAWRMRKARKMLSTAMRAGRLSADGSAALAKARGAHAEARARRAAAVEDGHGHWVEVMDPASHVYYYCDSHTHEVTWDKPEHYVMAADDEEMHAVILAQTAWRMRKAREAVARRAAELAEAARRADEASRLAEEGATAAAAAASTVAAAAAAAAATAAATAAAAASAAALAASVAADTAAAAATAAAAVSAAAGAAATAAAVSVSAAAAASSAAAAALSSAAAAAAEAAAARKRQKERAAAEEKRQQQLARARLNWVEVFDPASRSYYYCERHTYQATWIAPDEYLHASEDTVIHGVIVLQALWRRQLVLTRHPGYCSRTTARRWMADAREEAERQRWLQAELAKAAGGSAPGEMRALLYGVACLRQRAATHLYRREMRLWHHSRRHERAAFQERVAARRLEQAANSSVSSFSSEDDAFSGDDDGQQQQQQQQQQHRHHCSRRTRPAQQPKKLLQKQRQHQCQAHVPPAPHVAPRGKMSASANTAARVELMHLQAAEAKDLAQSRPWRVASKDAVLPDLLAALPQISPTKAQSRKMAALYKLHE